MRIVALLALTLASCGLVPSRHDAPVPTHSDVQAGSNAVTATETSSTSRTSALGSKTSGAMISGTGTSGAGTSGAGTSGTGTSGAKGGGDARASAAGSNTASAGANGSNTTNGQPTTSGQTPTNGSNTKSSTVEPTNPVQRLLAGNSRFVAGQISHPHDDPTRRTEVANGQKPFAVVVACSDSRVAPELVFDQGLGDLFVVRCAGNVVDDLALGSIEYAIEHLGARTIVVVGHERCGAVIAALEGGELPGHIAKLVEAIRPNLGALPARGKAALDEAVRANAGAVAERLEGCEPILSEYAREGHLTVLAARYDLDTGVVEFLTPTHP